MNKEDVITSYSIHYTKLYDVDFDSPKDRVELHSAEDAVEYFRKTISREQNRACNCVSPVFLQTMPPDMAEIKPEDRKQLS